MKHTVSYYIREQLRESRQVYIPGLGEFKLVQHAASIASQDNAIQPPRLTLEFSDTVGDELPLLKKISRVEDFSIEKARKKLTKFSNNIFNNLINLNRVKIKGVGTLVRQSDMVIKFVDTIDDLTDEYKGLKTIPLKEVRYNPIDQKPSVGVAASNIISQDEVFEPVSSTETIAKSNARNWLIPLIVGVLIALAYIFAIKASKGNSLEVEKGESVLAASFDTLTSIDRDALLQPEASTEEVQHVIVVGVFADRKNVDQMIRKIEQLGFTPYTSIYQKMTRVGIYSTSIDHDLETLRRDISPKAWVLEE